MTRAVRREGGRRRRRAIGPHLPPAAYRLTAEGRVLKVREDRRALLRRIEISRIIVGSRLRVARHGLLVRPDRAGRVLLRPFGEQPDPLRPGHGAARLRARPQRRGPRGERARPTRCTSTAAKRRTSKPRCDFAAAVLRLPREQVRARVERGLRDPEFLPITVAENLGIEEVAAIEARASGAPGVRDHRLPAAALHAGDGGGPCSRAISRRRPPNRSGAAQNELPRSETGSGQKGIEGSYEKLLAGVDGERRVVVDSHGREIAEEERIEARPGQNLFLTLDLELQRIAEELLPGQGRLRRRDGPADRRDPGPRLLALLRSELVHSPRDARAEWSGLLNDPHTRFRTARSRTPFRPARSSRSSWPTGRSPRGSWIRSSGSSVPGYATFYGRTFHCHKKEGHGWVDLRDAIKVSCDVYFYNLGRRLGIDRIAEISTRLRVRRADRRGSAVREDGPRSLGGMGARKAARALVSERDDLRRDRAGPRPRDAAADRAGAVGARRRAAACQRRISSSPRRTRRTERALRYQVGDASRASRSTPDKARDRQGRDVGGRERAGRHGVFFATAGRGHGRQDRDRAGRRPGGGRPGRRRDKQARGSRLVRRLRAGPGPADRRRRLRRERRPRWIRRGAARSRRSSRSSSGRRCRAGAQEPLRGKRRKTGHEKHSDLRRPASASRSRPGTADDLPGPPGSAAPRPDRPRVRARAFRPGCSLHRVDDRRRTVRGPGRAPGDLDRGRRGRDGRGDAVRLPQAAQGFLRPLRGEPAAAGLPARLRERIANVRSWIRFGGFQFQPAELAKIATALLVAYLFENEDDARPRLPPSSSSARSWASRSCSCSRSRIWGSR